MFGLHLTSGTYAGSNILFSSIQVSSGAVVVEVFYLLILSIAFTHRDWQVFHIEARDSDWKILAPIWSSTNASNIVKNLFAV